MTQSTTINGISIPKAVAYYQENAERCIDGGKDCWASAEVWYRALAEMAEKIANRAEGVS